MAINEVKGRINLVENEKIGLNLFSFLLTMLHGNGILMLIHKNPIYYEKRGKYRFYLSVCIKNVYQPMSILLYIDYATHSLLSVPS